MNTYNLDKEVKNSYIKDSQDPEFKLALSSTEETYTLGFMRGVDFATALLKLQLTTLNPEKKKIKIVLDEENARTLHY